MTLHMWYLYKVFLKGRYHGKNMFVYGHYTSTY